MKQKRQQAQKPRNPELAKAMMELRQGSRTAPIPSGRAYKRPKAGSKNKDW